MPKSTKPEKLPNGVSLWAGTVDSYSDWERQEKWVSQASAEDLGKLGSEIYANAEDDEFGPFGYMVSRYEDTAIVEIRGKLVPGSAWYNRYLGRTGYGEIVGALSQIAAIPGITSTLMNIDSTGGSTNGVGEAADAIKTFDKKVMPVHAFTSGNMLSAAMWLGSAARKRGATPMASVGSVGVIAVHTEYTEMMKKEGITVNVFREGANKALVNPYEKLTDKARSYIEAQLASLNTFFVQTLANNLSLTEAYVRDRIADGSEFFGAEAKELGLVDKITTLDKMLEGLVNRKESVSFNRLSPGADVMSLKPEETTKKETPLSCEAQAAASAGAPLEVAVKDHPATEQEEVAAEQTETEIVAETIKPAAESGMELLINKLASSQQEAADLKSKTAKLEEQLADAQAGAASLRTLCTEWAHRMQIPLGLTTLDSTNMSASTLAMEVSRIKTMFDDKYRPGQKVTAASQEDDSPASEGVVTSITHSRNKAVSFKR